MKSEPFKLTPANVEDVMCAISAYLPQLRQRRDWAEAEKDERLVSILKKQEARLIKLSTEMTKHHLKHIR